MLGASGRNRVVTLWPHTDRFSVVAEDPVGCELERLDQELTTSQESRSAWD